MNAITTIKRTRHPIRLSIFRCLRQTCHLSRRQAALFVRIYTATTEVVVTVTRED